MIERLVLADDLTGAAEIAGIAHAAGLRAIVLTAPTDEPLHADIVVLDTDTRLKSPADAAAEVRRQLGELPRLPHVPVFIKTDSVLRGNVVAEVEAARAALGLTRTLLVPCNPSIGRTIRDGQYFVAGQPLHHTGFGRDPHHPRQTSHVLDLLAHGDDLPALASSKPGAELAEDGIIVGEAETIADVETWAGEIDAGTLPAGAADFFRAWLARISPGTHETPAEPTLPGPALLLSGTHTPSGQTAPIPGEVRPLVASALPDPETLAAELRTLLTRDGAAALVMEGPLVTEPGTSEAIAQTFALTARNLRDADAFRHLIIAGGATSAAVLAALGWTQLEVVHVWGPGVVTLRPVADSSFFITLKPGSYAWPASLGRQLQNSSSISA
jgi:D-threonate/D-erythronate kinase